MRLILLSGPIAVGKSAVASVLIDTHSFRRIGSGGYLSKLARDKGLVGNRNDLQELGDDLDRETDYKWLIDDVAGPLIDSEVDVKNWLVDSVRKSRQIEHFRSKYREAVFHVHLTASEAILLRRYESRLTAAAKYEGATPYEAAIGHPNEVSARGLLGVADLVIDLGDTLPNDAAKLILVGAKI